MIRGAIAFGLVLRIDKSFENRDVVVTTSLSLVIFTTVVFGSLLGVIQKMLFGDPEKKAELENSAQRKKYSSAERRSEEKKKERETEEDKLSQLQQKLLSQGSRQRKDDETSGESNDEDSSGEDSETEGLEIHPNFDQALSAQHMSKKQKKYKKKKCIQYLLTCDKFILRPILIYKYEKQMAKKSKEFYQIYKQFGQEMETDFKGVQSLKRMSSKVESNKSDSSKFGKKKVPVKKLVQDPKNLSTNSPIIPENPAEHLTDMAPSLEPQENNNRAPAMDQGSNKP